MTRSRYHGIASSVSIMPAGGAQVARGLEERDDAERRRDAGLALQELDGEHVRRLPGHRDDVGAERFGMDRRHHAERVEHVGDARRPCGIRAGVSLRPCASTSTRNSTRRSSVQLRVLAESERARDRVERLGVTRRLPGGRRAARASAPKAAMRRRTSVSRPSAMMPLPVACSERWQSRSGSASSDIGSNVSAPR